MEFYAEIGSDGVARVFEPIDQDSCVEICECSDYGTAVRIARGLNESLIKCLT
jgi:hypothetical protein